MRICNYQIQVSADSVDVECDVPLRSSKLPNPKPSPHLIGSFFVLFALVMLYFSCFGHGRNPSIWKTAINSRPGSSDFVSNVIPFALLLVLNAFLFAVGIRYLLPFCERLHCDRSTLTWSKIPWVSFGNRRVTRSMPVTEIVSASYSIVFKGRSEHYYGILLETDGKPWKMFWGIESPEANRILLGLKGLGINVLHDPEMREIIRETLRDRRAEL
jgi:hypothetical protein